MAKTKTLPWDPAEHLKTEEDMAAYLNVALEENDLELIAATLEDIARASDDWSGWRAHVSQRRH